MNAPETIRALVEYLPTISGTDIHAPIVSAIDLLLIHAVNEDHPIHESLTESARL
jgi:hypothetical protein